MINIQPTDLLYKRNIPWNAIIEITNNCQLKCLHCFQKTHMRSENELSFNKVKSLIIELKRIGVLQITITGGEATLRDDFIEIIKFALKSDLKVLLLTNGQICDKKLKELKEIDSKKLTIGISLLGDENSNNLIMQNKDAYKRILHTITFLNDTNTKLNLNTVVMNQNFNALEHVEAIAKKYNIEWCHTPIIYGSNVEQFRLNDDLLFEYYNMFPKELILMELLLNNELKNINYDVRCNAGFGTILIDSEGNVYPCAWIKEIMGNVNDNTINDIWFNSKCISDFRERNDFGCKDCMDCMFFPICKRCPAYSKCMNNSYNGKPLEWCRNMKTQKKVVEKNRNGKN